MWQRFTEMARKAIFYAQEEAQRFGEGYVSTEHLLLGLCRDTDTVAARTLECLGLSMNQLRLEVEKQLPRGDARPSQDMTLTPRAKRVIDLAYDEARNLNNNYIGTEHLLLGLIREADGLAGRVLAKLGATLEDARRFVLDLQTGGEEDPKGSPQTPLRPATPGPASPDAERRLAKQRSSLVFVLANEPIRGQIKLFLEALGLTLVDWTLAPQMTGITDPTLADSMATALATAGAVVVEQDGSPERLFLGAVGAGISPKQTILLRLGTEPSLPEPADRLMIRGENSDEVRRKLALALLHAGCPANTACKEWLTTGDF